jgi:CRP/FNR family transcriptional regulator, cyclic AMP receptor protein
MSATELPFLRLLERADADALLERVRRRRLARGSVVLSGGSAGDHLVVLLEGRVKVVATGVDGRDVVLAIRGPGELIGEMAALGAQRRTATATAVDEVEVGYLEAEQFRTYVTEHPDAAMTLIRMLVRRLSEATREVVDLATQDSVGRVAKRLLELAADHGVSDRAGVRIDLSLTQDELASWTGATRETVSRALRLMRQLGWIATDHRSIIVLDAAAMRERCGLVS